MAKFENGDRVAITDDKGKKRHGTIVAQEGPYYSVFTDGGRLVKDRHSKQIQRAYSRQILVLESNLSSGMEALSSAKQRRQGPYLEELFRCFGWDVLREKVHEKESFRYFLSKVRNSPRVRFVHYGGHGGHFDGESSICFSAGYVTLPKKTAQQLEAELTSATFENIKAPQLEREVQDRRFFEEVFSKDSLSDKILVLSSCELGKKNGIAEFISRTSGARLVVAYKKVVSEHDCNVAEAMLYRLLAYRISKKTTPESCVKRVEDAFKGIYGYHLGMVAWKNGEQVA